MLGPRRSPLRALRRSITVRTLVVGVGLSAALGAAFVVLVIAVLDQRAAGRQALRSQEAISAGTSLESSLLSLENGLRGYVGTGRDRLLEPFETARRAYPAQVRRLTALVADEPAQQASVRLIQSEIDDYVNLWALPLLKLASGRLEVARNVIVSGAGRERLDVLRGRFAALFERERQVAARRELRAEGKSDLAVTLGYGGVGLVVLVAAGLWLYLRRVILRPVLEVSAASETVAAGDLSAHVAARRDDELGRLALAFNSMTESLAAGRSDLDQRTLELERSNRELEQYAQVTSHDLQAPVATIRMYGELLARRVGESDVQTTQLIAGIRSSAEHMGSLIRDLLHYSRVGRGSVTQDRVDTGDVVHRALENLAGPIGERGAQVHVGELPDVVGDAGQLCQVFQNLIGNGIKFSAAEQPRVGVTAVLEDTVARFSVSDNGVGIDPDDADRIFDPFHRSVPASAYEGTGIGLAIARKIVARHGGRIWARPRPDGGSVFHFTVPLATPAAGAPGPGASAPSSQVLST